MSETVPLATTPKIVCPETFRFCIFAVLIVELAIVEVASVDVPVDISVAMFALVIFAVNSFDVEALVVEAFSVAKFPVVPHSVVKNPVTEFRIFEVKLPVTVRLEAVVLPSVEDPVAKIFCAERFVVVALVSVAFVEDRLLILEEAFIIIPTVEVGVIAPAPAKFQLLVIQFPATAKQPPAIRFIPFPFTVDVAVV